MADFDHRKARELARQLPADEPPPYVLPARPQPLPTRRRSAQVYSTFDALPVGGRMFKERIDAEGLELEGATLWTFELPCPDGYVMVVREVQTFAIRTEFGLVASELRCTIRKSGAGLAFVDTVRVDAGDELPLYLIVGPGESFGFEIIGTSIAGGPGAVVEISGDLIRQRGLVPELEIGHDAPLVKSIPPDPEDLL